MDFHAELIPFLRTIGIDKLFGMIILYSTWHWSQHKRYGGQLIDFSNGKLTSRFVIRGEYKVKTDLKHIGKAD